MITFSSEYLAEQKNPNKSPDTIITLTLTGKTIKWGIHKHLDVIPCLESSISFQTKIDPSNSLATIGKLQFDIMGSANFNPVIASYRLKGRRVDVEEGFAAVEDTGAAGIARNKYVTTFTGVISDYNIDGEKLSLYVSDETELLRTKYPETNDSGTQYHDYSDSNPIDTMINLIATQAGVTKYDSTQFTSERDAWYNGWRYQRVITDSEDILDYLAQLQEETMSSIFHDGENIFFKSFAPLEPGSSPKSLSDDLNLLKKKTKVESGYTDAFFNRIEVYYNYDESGSDNKDENFESVYTKDDTDSQSDWGETITKVIQAKWIKTITFTQPSNITGCGIYHVSASNGISSGKTGHSVTFVQADSTLQWTAPDGAIGEAVTIEEDGRYTLYDADENKYIRVIVTFANLPVSDQSDTITIAALSGDTYAQIIGDRFLNRFSVPLPTISAEVDLKDFHTGGDMFAPMQTVELTSDKVAAFDKNGFTNEPCMLLSVKPSFGKAKAKITLAPTRLIKRYGFICPNGYPDYATATESERSHCFIGRTSDNKVYDGTNYVDGYYII
jgi:hypothetical protein